MSSVTSAGAVLVALALSVAGCAPGERATQPEMPLQTGAPRTVVLVAIDGVRWHEIFEGVDPKLADRFGLAPAERVDAATLTPNLHRLMTREGAAIGAPGDGPPMRASGPNFMSLPGYMEMLTGRTDSGCTDNSCGRVRFQTIADEVAQAGAAAAVIASWDGIDRAASALGTGPVVSVGRHGGSGRTALERAPGLSTLLADGERATPEPGHDDFRPDALTARLALAYLREEKPEFLFVGLGETDEYGHREDYRGYLAALRASDRIVGEIAEELSALDAEGRPSTLLVTTDHGRSDGFVSHGFEYPESARVFAIAAGADIHARGAVPSEHARKLADLTQTIRALVGLPLVHHRRAGRVITELFTPSPDVARRL